MSTVEDMKVTALVPWYGSNRMLAKHVGELLAGCRWVGVPFAGGMSELAHITAPTMVVNDLHRHVINLAKVVAHPPSCHTLVQRLENAAFHPDELEAAQDYCVMFPPNGTTDVNAAISYFITQWMGRSGNAGTEKEFTGGLPVRWNANGGDSNTRYRSAVQSLAAWGRIMQRCNFTTLDFGEFLGKCKDEQGHGIYCDPPFPAGGELYRHKFTEADHRRLCTLLGGFKKTRVVIRYYDHPLVRELYAGPQWAWKELTGRKSSNADAPEVLISNEGLA